MSTIFNQISLMVTFIITFTFNYHSYCNQITHHHLSNINDKQQEGPAHSLLSKEICCHLVCTLSRHALRVLSDFYFAAVNDMEYHISCRKLQKFGLISRDLSV